VRAAFTGIWVQSSEHEDALAEIAQMCKQEHWSMATWDVERGLQMSGQESPGNTDPLAAIRSINALAKPDSSALLVLPNFHRLVQGAEVVQCLAHQISTGKQNRAFIIILSPIVQIPVELQTHFAVIEHDLPCRDQLQQIAEGIATQHGEMPQGAELEKLLDAAAGLTRFEAENAFSLSLVRHGKLTPPAVWELKTGMLKKSGLLTLHRGTESFADLGGLDALKSFCSRALSRRNSLAKPRGILLLGVPGTGKSAFAKALGNETGRPTLVLDVGALMGSLVGSTEQNVRQTLRIADAMSPCILFCDEIEKGLSGVASSGQTDSGVSARLFGSLLTWLSDHESDVFFIATANDITKLPPEFTRAERFDAIHFIDIPGAQEKSKIWPLYLSKFNLGDQAEKRPRDQDWTGAEIRSCCRLAALLDVPLKEAAQHVVPVAVTASDSMGRLRTWASGRCLDATNGGIYNRAGEAVRPARRVSRPSAN
jgi:hypothetical protein